MSKRKTRAKSKSDLTLNPEGTTESVAQEAVENTNTSTVNNGLVVASSTLDNKATTETSSTTTTPSSSVVATINPAAIKKKITRKTSTPVLKVEEAILVTPNENKQTLTVIETKPEELKDTQSNTNSTNGGTIVNENINTVGTKESGAQTASPGGLNELDQKKKRAERFGIAVVESEQEKKSKRAERFGLDAEEKKKQHRAERFGTNINSEESTVDIERKKRRAERFGLVAGTPMETDEKLKQRAERFGLPVKGGAASVEEEEKKRKRAERFTANNAVEDNTEENAKKKLRS